MNIKNLINFIIALLLLCSYPPDTLAKMYKWIDENGGIHWSDRRPQPKNNVKTIKEYETIEDKEDLTALNTVRPPDGIELEHPELIYEKLESIKSKGEYETTKQYKSRLKRIMSKPFFTKTHNFLAYEPDTMYDADKAILEIEFTDQILRSFKNTLYISASKARRLNFIEHGVAFYDSNCIFLDILNKDRIKEETNSNIFSYNYIRLELEPGKAKRIVKNVRVIYVIKLSPYVAADEFEPKFYANGAFTSEECETRTEVRENGFESNTTSCDMAISVNLHEIIVYDDGTGDILIRLGSF